jgi:hypothetical protein
MGVNGGHGNGSSRCRPSLMSPRGGPSQHMQEQQRAAFPASAAQGSSRVEGAQL